jgi:hypothetical protein
LQVHLQLLVCLWGGLLFALLNHALMGLDGEWPSLYKSAWGNVLCDSRWLTSQAEHAFFLPAAHTWNFETLALWNFFDLGRRNGWQSKLQMFEWRPFQSETTSRWLSTNRHPIPSHW